MIESNHSFPPLSQKEQTIMAILTAIEFLQKGLELAGFSRRRQQRVCRATNLRRFKDHFGSLPVVYAQIWEDLQTTDIPEARIDARKDCVDSFLMAIHFLKCYPKEGERAAIFKICKKTARKWGWYFAEKVQALKVEKVRSLTAAYSLQ